jgi:hypothetical protein
MDLSNPIIRLCSEGSRAEFEGRFADARLAYWNAWQQAQNDFEACIAAHYVARLQASPHESFRWNQEALNRADRIKDDSVKSFYPSLYLNMGRSYELLGNPTEAQHYYDLAAQLGYPHQPE